MVSFDEAFSRLSRLTDYERKRPDRPHRFDLSGMATLCDAADHPELMLGRVVQVAGSKGKGTVTSLLAGMGRAAGLRTASYLSPHVVDVRERVQLDGEPAPKDSLVEPLVRVADSMRGEHTWFEAFTVAALSCFARHGPDLTVLEVGLGGRLDSTTFVPKAACCITGIELEHTKILGDTIEAVASEKAGILRRGVPCVTAAAGPALRVIEERAAKLACPLAVLGRDIRVSIQRRTAAGLDVRIETPSIRPTSFALPVHARVHVTSFALALATFETVFPDLLPQVLAADAGGWVRAALPPARFEILSWNPPLVVDGAHTDGSLAQLARELEDTFRNRRFRLVFAVALGKRWQTGLGRLARLVDRAWVAPLEGKAGVPPARIAKFLTAVGVPCRAATSIAGAVAEARSSRGEDGLVVTGSLYAAGDALRVLRPSAALR